MRIFAVLGAVALLSACDGAPKSAEKAAVVPATGAADVSQASPPVENSAYLAAYPNQQACMGYVDGPVARDAKGVTVIGWSWDTALKAAVPKIVLVDASGKIVAEGASGTDRGDVQRNVEGVTRADVGWSAIGPAGAGLVTVYAVNPATKAGCKLGEATL